MANKLVTSGDIVDLFGLESDIFKEIWSILLEKGDVQNEKFQAKFTTWKTIFRNIYRENASDILFLKHTYYCFILKSILLYIISPNKTFQFKDFQNNYSSNVFENFDLTEFELFDWIEFDISHREAVFELLNKSSCKSEDLFYLFYQQIFYNSTRHNLGEFYTPPILVQKMIAHSYRFGDKVLDPSCGSGNFIMEILLNILDSDYSISHKIKAIQQVYGFDINPLATLTAKINLLILYYEKLPKFPSKSIKLNIFLADSLYLPKNLPPLQSINLENFFHSFDLIIGNPPWLTYKDAENPLRKQLKQLTQAYNIKPSAHNITNIEEAVVFFYRIPHLFLKQNGDSYIAFVMPRSILVSSQNQKARRFTSFDSIEVFEFDNAIFNIDFCCLFAKYLPETSHREKVFEKYPIKCIKYTTHANHFKKMEEYTLEPYVYFETKKGDEYIVKNLIKTELKKDLLPCALSDYYPHFIQGADLLPKSLLYVESTERSNQNDTVDINPWISPQAKGVWKKRYFSDVEVEKDHLFKATLSRGLYPYYIKLFDIFLPLDKKLVYNPDALHPHSLAHWNNIKKIYADQRKKDLFEVGINYRNKLCTKGTVKEAQRAHYKVVFPNAKTLMAAVVEDPRTKTFIDSTLYYYGTKNKDEAYYLCGMLNINKLYESVKAISDTRHHHKRPLYFHIPQFEQTSQQLNIAKLAKKNTHIVANYFNHSNKKISLRKIRTLTHETQKEIDLLGIDMLCSNKTINIIRPYLSS
jgi:hypothetical protein